MYLIPSLGETNWNYFNPSQLAINSRIAILKYTWFGVATIQSPTLMWFQMDRLYDVDKNEILESINPSILSIFYSKIWIFGAQLTSQLVTTLIRATLCVFNFRVDLELLFCLKNLLCNTYCVVTCSHQAIPFTSQYEGYSWDHHGGDHWTGLSIKS